MNDGATQKTVKKSINLTIFYTDHIPNSYMSKMYPYDNMMPENCSYSSDLTFLR